MTVLLWIVGVLLGLGVLIALTRVGIRVEMGEQGITAVASVGVIHIRVFPGKSTTDDAAKAGEPEPKKPGEKKKSAGSKPTLAEIKSLVQTLWPPLKKALARTRRSIRIHPMQLSLTVGGEEDPAAAAQRYGELHGAVWTIMPILEQLLDIRDPFIHLGIDFDARETKIEGKLGISIRIGSLIRIAFGLAVPAIRWYMDFRKAHGTKQPSEPTPAAGTAN